MIVALTVSRESQKKEQEERENEMKQLNLLVESCGYSIMQNVPYDGNCFFNSVAVLIGSRGPSCSERFGSVLEIKSMLEFLSPVTIAVIFLIQ